MKRGGKTLICLLCIIALTPKVRAVVNDSPTEPANNEDAKTGEEGPYSAIWLRNVFDLKPAPTLVVPPATVTNAPPPNVELTGITTLLGTKRALFMVQDAPGPGKPAGKDESYILTEGERQGVLEVLEINPKAKTVKIKVSDLVSTITFKTNKPAIGSQAVAATGGIPRPPVFNPAGFNPAGMPGANPGSAMPTRSMRPTADNSQYSPQGGQYNNGQNGYNPQAAQGGYGGGYNQSVGGIGGVGGVASSTTPGLTLPGFGNSTPMQQTPAPIAAPPEVTGAIWNLQNQAAQNEGRPFPPPLPPFQTQQPGGGGSEGGEQTTPTQLTPPSIPGQRVTGTATLPPFPPMPTR